MIADLKELVDSSAELEQVWLFETQQPYYVLNRAYAERRMKDVACRVYTVTKAAIKAAATDDDLFKSAEIVKDTEIIKTPKRKKK